MLSTYINTLRKTRPANSVLYAFGLAVSFFIFAACSTTEPAISEPTVIPPEIQVVAAPPREAPPEPVQSLIEMVSITGGSFTMGTPRGTRNSLEIERPPHQVTIRSFLLGKYEVTQGQYFEVTGTRPSQALINRNNESPDGWKQLPVEMVTWYEAIAFCNRLSIKENLRPVYRINDSVNPDDWGNLPRVRNPTWDAVEMIIGANGYRLPTEAEWEYAARGGTASRGFMYAGSNTPDTVSWYYDNASLRVHEIGLKQPNELGLYDMSGNVMEWCWDWLADYTAEPKDNPTGPIQGMYRTIRGGAWSTSVIFSRIAYRHNNLPSYRGVNLGFRVARSE